MHVYGTVGGIYADVCECWVHIYADVGCISMERLGAKYADVGCIYADVGCLSMGWLGA